ncbi:TorF family putative porin [Bradyrhizobium amphicarpaeae]|uniref:Porin n=1 Tax=Bradyrhizobium amphicarpaeae TaxID=1404768 RepID=A0A2U8Q301_9BRAD|nr:TorF family putative porin [Bradyrhizobium amphicarpaeae]AWM04490.1 hypothetical protein CIT40_03790 [Bradyrhizobium amphicarpaeae]
MKKVALLATALAMVTTGSAFAADMAVKAKKAPPVVAFDPWDIAFGAAIMNDYIFRGITQSNHKASVAAYFEPRYNVTKDLQLYAGVAGESISFPNRAAAEIDIYGGIRPTFGAFAFDVGVWGYLYPGGTCYYGGGAVTDTAGNALNAECIANTLTNLNVAKRDASFYEVYGKVTYTVNDSFSFGLNEFYSPNFLNTGAWGNYLSITGKWIAPSTIFGASGVGMYVSGEFGRQWFGTSDSFYGVAQLAGFPNYTAGIPEPSYNTWNIGVGFTYKVMTLDLRYSDTDLSKGDCNAFTSAFNATGTTNVTPINPGGASSNWCGAAGVAKLSFDLTAMTNLK